MQLINFFYKSINYFYQNKYFINISYDLFLSRKYRTIEYHKVILISLHYRYIYLYARGQ